MIIAIIIFIFNVFLLIYPRVVLAAAREGLLLWFNNVLPSLLPFIIATNMMIALGFAQLLGGVFAPIMNRVFKLPGAGGFALVTGLMSGYPMGAKVVADLKRQGQISTQDSQHLLAFCNNAGPLFIVGVVGVGLFHSSRIGYILWAAHVLAALGVGVIYGCICGRPMAASTVGTAFGRPQVRPTQPIGTILGDAVKNAMESMVFIGGLIIFFNVIVAVVAEVIDLDATVYSGVLAGLAEVTGGVKRLAAFEPGFVTLCASAFVIAFGGFSIHAQTFHFMANTGVKAVPYLLAKLLHGLLSAGITAVLWQMMKV